MVGVLIFVNLYVIFLAPLDAALLRPSDYHTSYDTNVALSENGEKRSLLETMPHRYELNVKFSNKNIKMNLVRKGHKRDVRLYRPQKDGLSLVDNKSDGDDWAIYHGDGSHKAAVLIKRENNRLSVEGSLSHDDEHYMIQPNSDTPGHTLYHLNKYYKKEPIKDFPTSYKRAASRKLEVEVFMFFDHGMYRLVNNYKGLKSSTEELIKELYGLLINDMDYRYKSIRDNYNLDINIIMGGVAYFKSRNEMPFAQSTYPSGWHDTIDSKALLDRLRDYVIEKMPGIDEVLLQSGFDFPGGNLGLAWYNGTCQKLRSGVVCNELNFRAGHISAHELGHNLNMQHDVGGSCFNNYNMYPSVVTLISQTYPLNSWEFSYCSYTNLHSYIDTLDKDKVNCLTYRSSKKAMNLNKYGNRLYGQELTFDQQCAMTVGKGSEHCTKDQNRYDPEKICLTIYCTDPNDEDNCLNRFSFPGTPCGNRKMCFKGKCTESSSAKPMHNECLFGDRKDKFVSGSTCAQMIPSYPMYCYNKSYRRGCCLSCSKHKRPGKKTCVYGDYSIPNNRVYIGGRNYYDCKSLVTAYPGFCYTLGGYCCESCPPLRKAGKNTCYYGDKVSTQKPMSIDGRTYYSCAKAVKHSPGICYKFEDHCCESCPPVANDKDRYCKYGDHPGKAIYDSNNRQTTCARAITASSPGLCYKNYDKCCGSCKKYKRAERGCEYGDKVSEKFYVGNRRYGCSYIIKERKGLCYERKKICCETCKKFDSGDSACRYGDVYGEKFWKNNRQVDCQSGISENDASLCYDSNIRKKCCASCKKYKKDVAGCEYGNRVLNHGITIHNYRHSTCRSAIQSLPGVCYTYKRDCCKSCAEIENTKEPKCRYGDKYFYYGIDVDNANYKTCKQAYAANKGMCYKNEADCCKTCKPGNDPSCPYGDYPGKAVYNYYYRYYDRCYRTVTSSRRAACYDDSVAKKCCESCAKYRKPEKKGCEYGDRSGDIVYKNGRRYQCSSVIRDHDSAGYCYEYADKCCESCDKFKSKDKECLYGDKPGEVVYVTYNRRSQKMTCKRAVSLKKSVCNNTDIRRECCRSCGGSPKVDK